jgi:hypothetical protein
MIKETQKQILFEESITNSLKSGNLVDFGSFLRSVIPVESYDTTVYGKAFAHPYIAIPNTTIDVDRIRKYFYTLSLDLKTLNRALLVSKEEMINLPEYVMKRLSAIHNKISSYEEQIAGLSNSQYYSLYETFSTTENLDLDRSTNLFVDTSFKGITIQPLQLSTIKPSSMQVVTSFDNNIKEITSNVFAFDHNRITSWTIAYGSDGFATLSIKLTEPQNLNGITFDVNSPIYVEIYTKDNLNLAKGAISYKSVFSFQESLLDFLTIKIKPSSLTYPAIVSIKNIFLHHSMYLNYAEVYSKEISIPNPYGKVLYQPESFETSDAKIKSYISTSSGGPWILLEKDKWINIFGNWSGQQLFGSEDLVSEIGKTYSYDLSNSMLERDSDSLYVGHGQIGVSCNKNPNQFVVTSIASYDVNTSSYSINTSSTNNVPTQVQAGQKSFVLERPIDLSYDELSREYKELVFCPLSGFAESHTARYGNTYTLEWIVECDSSVVIPNVYMYMLQGIRALNKEKYSNLGRSFVSISLSVNDTVIYSEEIGGTVYPDLAIPDLDLVETSVSLTAGTNKFKLICTIPEYEQILLDTNDLTEPFVQFSMYPSIFDTKFLLDYPQIKRIFYKRGSRISNILDLIFNSKEDGSLYSVDYLDSKIYFNTNAKRAIDGIYSGTNIVYQADYLGLVSTSGNSTWLRHVLTSTKTNVAPVLQKYRMVFK